MFLLLGVVLIVLVLGKSDVLVRHWGVWLPEPVRKPRFLVGGPTVGYRRHRLISFSVVIFVITVEIHRWSVAVRLHLLPLVIIQLRIVNSVFERSSLLLQVLVIFLLMHRSVGVDIESVVRRRLNHLSVPNRGSSVNFVVILVYWSFISRRVVYGLDRVSNSVSLIGILVVVGVG